MGKESAILIAEHIIDDSLWNLIVKKIRFRALNLLKSICGCPIADDVFFKRVPLQIPGQIKDSVF